MNALPPLMLSGIKSPLNSPDNIYNWATTGEYYDVTERILSVPTQLVVNALGREGIEKWFIGVTTTMPDRTTPYYTVNALALDLAVLKFQDVLSPDIWKGWWLINHNRIPERVTCLDLVGIKNFHKHFNYVHMDIQCVIDLAYQEHEELNSNHILTILSNFHFDYGTPKIKEDITKSRTEFAGRIRRTLDPDKASVLFKWFTEEILPLKIATSKSFSETITILYRLHRADSFVSETSKQLVLLLTSACAQAENPVEVFLQVSAALINETHNLHEVRPFQGVSTEWFTTAEEIIPYLSIPAREQIFLQTALSNIEAHPADRFTEADYATVLAQFNLLCGK